MATTSKALPGLMGSATKKTTNTPATKKPAASTNSTAVKKAAADLVASQSELTKLLGQLATGLSSGTGGTTGGRTDASYMAEGYSGTSTTGQNYIEGRAVTPQEFNAWLYGTSSGSAANKDKVETIVDPEFDAIVAGLKVYGIEGLATTIESIRSDNPGISGEGMMSLMRNDARYNANYLKRFSGNELLAKAGKPMLDEKTYLANEAAYAKTFAAYELPRFANQTQYATLIANSVSPDEAASRVSLAYDRILKSEPEKLAAFKKFYPTLSTADLVATMLDPTNQLPALERKVVAAEIGGAAIAQGLQADLAASYTQSKLYSNLNVDTLGAEAIQQAGTSASAAKTGYETIAAELPTMEKLSSIYASTLDNYTQSEAEQEQFQGLASAKRKKQALLAAEAAQFSGTSGLTKSSLMSETTGKF